MVSTVISTKVLPRWAYPAHVSTREDIDAVQPRYQMAGPESVRLL